MWLPRPALIALGLAAASLSTSVFATPTECEDKSASCRESCSMEYGMDVERRDGLGLCLRRCEDKGLVCEKRATQSKRTESNTLPVPPVLPPVKPPPETSVRYVEIPQYQPSTGKAADGGTSKAEPAESKKKPAPPPAHWGGDQLN